MKYRKLRIAWSVGWGAICVLAVALWVRSYLKADVINVNLPSERMIQLLSARGLFAASAYRATGEFAWISLGLEGGQQFDVFQQRGSFQAFYRNAAWTLIVPHWFLVILASLFASIPWRPWRWRFSLRTLLIAMTLVAVALGLIIALSR